MTAAWSTAAAYRGVSASPHAFIGRVTDTLWVAAAFSAVGIVAALASPGRTRASATAERTATAAVHLMTVEES